MANFLKDEPSDSTHPYRTDSEPAPPAYSTLTSLNAIDLDMSSLFGRRREASPTPFDTVALESTSTRDDPVHNNSPPLSQPLPFPPVNGGWAIFMFPLYSSPVIVVAILLATAELDWSSGMDWRALLATALVPAYTGLGVEMGLLSIQSLPGVTATGLFHVKRILAIFCGLFVGTFYAYALQKYTLKKH